MCPHMYKKLWKYKKNLQVEKRQNIYSIHLRVVKLGKMYICLIYLELLRFLVDFFIASLMRYKIWICNSSRNNENNSKVIISKMNTYFLYSQERHQSLPDWMIQSGYRTVTSLNGYSLVWPQRSLAEGSYGIDKCHRLDFVKNST